ncbi:hypothetical protein ACXYL9_11710 [Qipengyuania sp. CAU 1752]
MDEPMRPRAPWHLWVAGIFGVLWFAGGAWDYVQTQLRNEDYLGEMAESVGTDLQVILDYYDAFPAWVDAMWALSVWAAVAGALLLLARSRFAYHAMIVSMIGLVGSTIYTYTTEMPEALNSPFTVIFSIVIWATIILFAFYARQMTAAGVLR